jgi:sulfite exporter TauE/SafE
MAQANEGQTLMWAIIGVAFGAASKDLRPDQGAEIGLTIAAAAMLAFAWFTYFRLKRRQAKGWQHSRRGRS